MNEIIYVQFPGDALHKRALPKLDSFKMGAQQDGDSAVGKRCVAPAARAQWKC